MLEYNRFMIYLQLEEMQTGAVVFGILFVCFILYCWVADSNYQKGYDKGFNNGARSKPYDYKKFGQTQSPKKQVIDKKP